MTTTPGADLTGQGLFRLSPELRNAVYEDVLADVEDNVCIRIEGGANANHKKRRLKTIKRRVLPEDDEESRLSLLLTFKQVYSEASSIAYSRMSMSLEDNDKLLQGDILLAGQHLANLMGGLQAVFGKEKLQLIWNFNVNIWLFFKFITFDSSLNRERDKPLPMLENDWKRTGPLFDAFHKVRRLTIRLDMDCPMAWLINRLPEGESWLTVMVVPGVATTMLLKTFSELREFVVHHPSAEQISKVIDGNVFAAKSGLPLRDLPDVLPK